MTPGTGRTQYYVAASLDGFIADADGRLEWLFAFDGAEGVAERYAAFIDGVGALAMGAATYEFILDHPWPYSDRPAWVFTHRKLPALAGADVRFTSGDVATEHAAMVRAAAGRNVWTVGGGNLAAQLARRGLLDELIVTVVPVVLGAGAPLLPARLAGTLALRSATPLGRGLVELRYDVPRPR